MFPDQVSNPGPLTYESGALSIALRGPAFYLGHCPNYEENNEVLLRIVVFDCLWILNVDSIKEGSF